MTSVVDTSVKHFTSAMTNAPVLNGVAGTLVGLLDACLVDGFDLKTATSLTVVDGVATLAFSGSHSAIVDSVILVGGSSIAALNGEQKITSKDTGILRFATAAADGTATGTITFKMAPAGWTKAYSGANKAAYKSSDVASTGCYLRVDDSGTVSARVVGYESMTGIDTGVGPFPTTAQISGGGYWHKSSTANASANNWVLVADERFFHLFMAPQSGNQTVYIQGSTRGFGDSIALRPSGDAYCAVLAYASSTSPGQTPNGTFDADSSALHAMPRNYSALGSSALHVCRPYIGSTSNISGCDSTFGEFPSVVDGGLRLSGRFFTTSTNTPPRSDLPGFYTVPQSALLNTFGWGDTIPGTGTLSGRTLLALTPGNAPGNPPTSSNTGISFVDITGPWR